MRFGLCARVLSCELSKGEQGSGGRGTHSKGTDCTIEEDAGQRGEPEFDARGARDRDGEDPEEQRNDGYDGDVRMQMEGSSIAPQEMVGLGGIVDCGQIVGHGDDRKKHEDQQSKRNDCSGFSAFEGDWSEGEVTAHE